MSRECIVKCRIDINIVSETRAKEEETTVGTTPIINNTRAVTEEEQPTKPAFVPKEPSTNWLKEKAEGWKRDVLVSGKIKERRSRCVQTFV